MLAQSTPFFTLPKFLVGDKPLPWLLPLLVLMLVFAIFPFFYNIYLSFHEFSLKTRGLVYVGWGNWEKLFTDPRFWSAFSVTMIYCSIALVVQTVLGMAIALLLDENRPEYTFIRGLLTLTLVIPPAIAGMMFLLMEDAEFGVLTYFLERIGLLTKETPILATPSLALGGVLIVDIWQWTPFMVLIFLAGLRALPREPYEAAMIDGANPFQTFIRLTLPMMGRVIAIAVLIRAIDLFRTFDYVYVMTSGGPGVATYTLSLYAWQQTFSLVKWGYGATLSLFSLFIILLIANLFIKITKVRW